MVFLIACIAALIWVASLIVRRMNHRVGVIMSYIALFLLVVGVVLHFVLR
ncbi:MAG: hypothetical protein IKQ70_04175 [Bacteroidales bacterium]|nr:hypothetical protein [Bacteroidales bacterium]